MTKLIKLTDERTHETLALGRYLVMTSDAKKVGFLPRFRDEGAYLLQCSDARLLRWFLEGDGKWKPRTDPYGRRYYTFEDPRDRINLLDVALKYGVNDLTVENLIPPIFWSHGTLNGHLKRGKSLEWTAKLWTDMALDCDTFGNEGRQVAQEVLRFLTDGKRPTDDTCELLRKFLQRRPSMNTFTHTPKEGYFASLNERVVWLEIRPGEIEYRLTQLVRLTDLRNTTPEELPLIRHSEDLLASADRANDYRHIWKNALENPPSVEKHLKVPEAITNAMAHVANSAPHEASRLLTYIRGAELGLIDLSFQGILKARLEEDLRGQSLDDWAAGHQHSWPRSYLCDVRADHAQLRDWLDGVEVPDDETQSALLAWCLSGGMAPAPSGFSPTWGSSPLEERLVAELEQLERAPDFDGIRLVTSKEVAPELTPAVAV